MIHIDIICLGKLKESYWADACREYEKRLGAFCRLRTMELTPVSLPEKPNDAQIAAALEAEAQAILEKIPQGSLVYALCIEGIQRSSQDFSAELAQAAVSGAGKICFLIGSSHGLAQRIKQRAQQRFSFSQMTFPHQLARVMLLEQIYRAFMIERGGKYHK